MKYAIAIYTEYTSKNEIKIVDAHSDVAAIQIAIEGYADTVDVSVDHLIGYYWDSKKIVISKPMEIR